MNAIRLAASVSAMAISIAAIPAHAQTASPVSDQKSAENLVVTGIRGSIQKAQYIKRHASSVVEVISSQDLGKFSDPSIADALQRVPGVSIERNSAKGLDGIDGATIRGLGSQYVATTVNGRDQLGVAQFFGYGGRDFDYSSIPPNVLAGVTIYKSPVASIHEAGLAGEIDLKTIRPLEYKAKSDFFGAFSIGGNWETRRRRVGPEVSAIGGIKLLNNTLGIYIAGTDSNQFTRVDREQSYNSQHNINVRNGDGTVSVIQNVNTIDGFSYNVADRSYRRQALSGGLQFRPNKSLDINADMQLSRYDVTNDDQGGDANTGYSFFTNESNAPGSQAPIFEPGGYKLNGSALTFYDTAKITTAPGAPASNVYTGITRDRPVQKIANFGLNIAWHPVGPISITSDFSHGYSERFDQWISAYTYPFLDAARVIFDGSGSAPKTTWVFPAGVNPSSPSSYGAPAQFIFQNVAKGRRDAARLDLGAMLNSNLTLKVGAAYQRSTWKNVLGFGRDHGPIDPTGFYDGTLVHQPSYNFSMPAVSITGFCKANIAYCTQFDENSGSFGGWTLPASVAGLPSDKFDFQPGNSFLIRERNAAVYGELDASGSLFGIEYSGNAGLRGVNIQEAGTAYQSTEFDLSFNGAPDPLYAGRSSGGLISDTNEYWRVLPAANLTLKPNSNVNLRFGVAKTLSLPQYDLLAPNVSVKIETPFNGASADSLFTGGNTRLKPTSAWNYDVTTEFYDRTGGALIVSAFYKQVKDLTVQTTTLNTTVPAQYSSLVPPDFANARFDVTTVVNANKGYTDGFEVNANQPLTFLPSPFDGLGAQANYTYVNSVLHVLGEAKPTAFPGSSRHNVNVNVYYEKYGWTLRGALSWRSTYLSSVGTHDSSIYTRAYSTIDASLTRKVGRHLDVIFSAFNIGGTPIVQYVSSGRLFFSRYQRNRSFSLAVRGNF